MITTVQKKTFNEKGLSMKQITHEAIFFWKVRVRLIGINIRGDFHMRCLHMWSL